MPAFRLMSGVGTLVLGVILGGCQSDSATRPPQASSTAQTDRARASGQAVQPPTVSPGPTTVMTSPISAKTLALDVAHRLAYSGKNGKLLIVRRTSPPDCYCAGRTWTVSAFEVEGQPDVVDLAGQIIDGTSNPPADLVQTFTVLPGGGIGVTEQIDRREDVYVRFEPPLLVMPDSLPMVSVDQAQMTQDLTMTVYELRNRAKLKRAGKATNVVRYLSDESLQTPAGTFKARKVQSTFSADLKGAKVNNTSEQWYVDGIGLVKEKSREMTSFLVPVRNNSAEWVLERYEK